MAKIGFGIWPMASEMHGSFKLAHILRNAGHDVFYIGVSDCRKYVEANGFELRTILEDDFREGLLEGIDLKIKQLSGIKRLFYGIRQKRFFQGVLNRLSRRVNRDIEYVLESEKPDLLIIGSNTPYMTLIALVGVHYGIQIAYLTQQTPLDPDRLVREAEQREDMKSLTPLGIVRFTNHWRWRIREHLMQLDWSQIYRRFAKNYNIPKEDLDFEDFKYLLKRPVLFLWPEAFMLPHVSYERFYYIGALMDLERSEESFEMSDSSRLLVYCSLGQLLPWGMEVTMGLFRTIIDAMKELTHCDVVISVGNYIDINCFENVPSHITLMNVAPQLSILKRAAVMITHGGPGAVKECIFNRVPMVVLPMSFETPENAERIQFHDLGMVADTQHLDAETLRSMIEMVMDSKEIEVGMERMYDAFQAYEDGVCAVATVERLLNAKHSILSPCA